MGYLQSVLGLLAFTGLAWAISENRRAYAPARLARLLAGGIGLQFAIALLLVKLPPAQTVFLALNDVVSGLQAATQAGTAFVFGYLGGGDLPFTEPYPGASFVLAFQALPLILVMSALSALLWHWRVLPLVVHGFAWALRRTLGVSGALGLGAAANVFVGMVEAPLLVRPTLATMPRGDLFTLMTCGMATIAGTVMVLYAGFLAGVVDNPVGHILTASLISAPAAILLGRLMVPNDAEAGDAEPDTAFDAPRYATAMDAITQGTADGVRLLINVVAMLVVLVALVALVNQILGLLPAPGGTPLTFQGIAGTILAPVAWLMGVPWAEAVTAGQLLGTKVVLNELVAYLDLAGLEPGTLSDRSRLILVYALCGFANFGSLGIMLGGLTAMAPDRRADIVGLGLRTILSGLLATCMTGCVIAIVVP
jgi:CNT family concentrative nucleoside transporter